MQAPPGSPKRRGRSTRAEVVRQGPKKGGHGGWGKISDQGGDSFELYIGDPNFDDEDEWVDGLPPDFQPRRKRNNSSITFEVSTPRVAPHDMEDLTKQQIRQYLLNEDMDDFVASVEKMKIDADAMGEILYYAVNLAMDHELRECELVSSLISGLFPKYCSDEAVRKGFNQLVMCIDEMTIDCPTADDKLAKFLARAVADDCLAPCFLQQKTGLSPLAVGVVNKASKLLNGPHGMARLDSVWGHVGGSADLDDLKDKIAMLISEYVTSGDDVEASRCLQELAVPHYHHEAVYQIAYNALQNPDSGDLLCALLGSLTKANIIAVDRVDQGIRRIYGDMMDIAVDIPYAYEHLAFWLNDARSRNVISAEVYADKPRAARKRYASSTLTPASLNA